MSFAAYGWLHNYSATKDHAFYNVINTDVDIIIIDTILTVMLLNNNNDKRNNKRIPPNIKENILNSNRLLDD